MWTRLEEIHMAKKAGARFNAYDDLFSIRKKEEESLMSVTNRIDSAIHTIQNLRPQGFTLDKLDEELASMAMICSLPDDYLSFVSSLLLMDKLEKSTIHQAFQRDEYPAMQSNGPLPQVYIYRIPQSLAGQYYLVQLIPLHVVLKHC
jgi:gag-polypeptide of LTR copia-type